METGFLVSLLINPLTPKIGMIILSPSCYLFPCKLFGRIWCSVKIISCTWWVWTISQLVCWIMYGYYREKLHDNHLRVKGLRKWGRRQRREGALFWVSCLFDIWPRVWMPIWGWELIGVWAPIWKKLRCWVLFNLRLLQID